MTTTAQSGPAADICGSLLNAWRGRPGRGAADRRSDRLRRPKRQMPAGGGVYAVAMLMVVRDYLQPLPTLPGPDGAEQVTPDLAEMARCSARAAARLASRGSRSPRSGPGLAPRCLLVTRSAATETRPSEGYGAPAVGDNGHPVHHRRPAQVLARR